MGQDTISIWRVLKIVGIIIGLIIFVIVLILGYFVNSINESARPKTEIVYKTDCVVGSLQLEYSHEGGIDNSSSNVGLVYIDQNGRHGLSGRSSAVYRPISLPLPTGTKVPVILFSRMDVISKSKPWETTHIFIDPHELTYKQFVDIGDCIKLHMPELARLGEIEGMAYISRLDLIDNITSIFATSSIPGYTEYGIDNWGIIFYSNETDERARKSELYPGLGRNDESKVYAGDIFKGFSSISDYGVASMPYINQIQQKLTNYAGEYSVQ